MMCACVSHFGQTCEVCSDNLKECYVGLFLDYITKNYSKRCLQPFLGVVHNCQHLCISTESTRGEGGPRPAYYF